MQLNLVFLVALSLFFVTKTSCIALGNEIESQNEKENFVSKELIKKEYITKTVVAGVIIDDKFSEANQVDISEGVNRRKRSSSSSSSNKDSNSNERGSQSTSRSQAPRGQRRGYRGPRLNSSRFQSLQQLRQRLRNQLLSRNQQQGQNRRRVSRRSTTASHEDDDSQ